MGRRLEKIHNLHHMFFQLILSKINPIWAKKHLQNMAEIHYARQIDKLSSISNRKFATYFVGVFRSKSDIFCWSKLDMYRMAQKQLA